MLFPETTQWLPPSSSLRTDGKKRYKQITRPDAQLNGKLTRHSREYNSRSLATLTSQTQPSTARIAFSILARLSLQLMARMYQFRSWTGLRYNHSKRGLHKVYDNTATQRSLHKVHFIRATLGLVYTCLGASLAGQTLLA